LNVELENCEQQLFLGFEAVVETAGVGVGAIEYFSDSSGGVAAEPEELEGGFNEALAGWDGVWLHLVEYSTKSSMCQ